MAQDCQATQRGRRKNQTKPPYSSEKCLGYKSDGSKNQKITMAATVPTAR
jgi:hypothetical protein